MTKLALGGARGTSLPPGHKHAHVLTYKSADPTQTCLPTQGTPTQFTPSKQAGMWGPLVCAWEAKGLEEAARNIPDALP